MRKYPLAFRFDDNELSEGIQELVRRQTNTVTLTVSLFSALVKTIRNFGVHVRQH